MTQVQILKSAVFSKVCSLQADGSNDKGCVDGWHYGRIQEIWVLPVIGWVFLSKVLPSPGTSPPSREFAKSLYISLI